MLRQACLTRLPLIRARIAPLGGLRGGLQDGGSGGGSGTRFRDVMLLVDTGASSSCISNEIAFDLQLDMYRQEIVNTPAGQA